LVVWGLTPHKIHSLVGCSSVIEIEPRGWRLLAESPVKFRRAEGMRPLPIPVSDGCLDDLKTFVNLANETDWRLIVSVLLQWFCPFGPYPILVFNGEHGSAKSTTAKALRDLVDPNSASHSGPPTDARDVAIAASNQRIVSLDNLSHIPDWLSDALCRLATGGGLRTRRLYTDAEETILEVQRPVILNGIEQLTPRPDLMDRSVVISLPKVLSYRDEKGFWNMFQASHPRLLGAILDTVVCALALLPRVILTKKPRMADFATWGTAIEQVLGWGEGAFMAAYANNRESANDSVLEGSSVATALEKLVAATGLFAGTASSLLKELERQVDDREKSQRTWPRSSLALRNALKRLAPSLRMAGIEVSMGERDKTRNRNRIVRVSRVSSELSALSADHRNQQHGEPTIADGPLRMDARGSGSSDGNSLKIRSLDSTDGADASSALQASIHGPSDYIVEDV
jgi:hypothetical protein